MKIADFPGILRIRQAQLVKHEGTVVAVEAPDLGEIAMIGLGQALMRMWLTAHVNGLYLHPLTQIIDSAETRATLTELLDVQPPERIVELARIGYSDQPARSDRLR